MGYQYIHENDLLPFIEKIKTERAIPNGYCTLEEATNILGLHRQTILRWISQGEIESKQVVSNNYWQTFVKKDSLQTVKRKKRKNMLKNFVHVDAEKLSEQVEKKSSMKENKPDSIDFLSSDHFYEVKDAVELLGVKNNTLLSYLRNGKFPSAIKVKNKWYIPKEDILSYRDKLENRNRYPLKGAKKIPPLEGHLSISEVSTRLNLSKSGVLELIYKGLFPDALKANGKWFVPEKDLNLYYESKKKSRSKQTTRNTPMKYKQPPGYLTIKEAAKKLKITSASVYRLIHTEKLVSAKKMGNKWLIPDSSLIEYKGKNQISVTKPDMIQDLKQFIKRYQNNENIKDIKETIEFYSEFSTTRLNATNGRINNVRKVFNNLKRLYSEVIINLDVEIYQLSDKDIESITKNKSYSTPIRELFVKFLKEVSIIKGKKSEKEYVVSRKGKNPDTDIDSERYSPKDYYLFEQHVKDIEKHIYSAIESRQYANMWVLTTMLLTNAWRPSDIIFEMPHIDIKIIDILEFDWFKKNRLSQEQCQLIINQLYLKLNNAEVSKTKANLHFLVAPDMVKCLAYACVISELHCRSVEDHETLYEKERLLLGTFVPGITETPITSGTNFHKMFFDDKPELTPFSSKKLHDSTMTYLFLDISEDEKESELALETVKWARSHEDINVTAGYIKLTNKDGSLERVSVNLFKRGHFGWLYNYMVQLAFSNSGVHQTLEERTRTIAELRKEYSPLQIEEWANNLLAFKNSRESIVKRLYKMKREQLQEVVIKIYKGQIPSRDGCGQCLSFPDCQFPHRKTCIGCVNFIPQIQQVLIEAREEFYRLIDSLKDSHTDAILKRDSMFLFNILLLFNEASETFGNDIVNGFLPAKERKTAIYSIADKVKLPTVKT